MNPLLRSDMSSPYTTFFGVPAVLTLRQALNLPKAMDNAKNTSLSPFLERLLDGEAVEWRTLGEVCDYEQPTAYLVRNTNYSDQYPIPVLTAGKTFILGYTNETTGIYRASEHPTIIFDDFTTANKWVDFDFKAKSSAMKMLTSKDEKVCLLKYIFYWLNTLPADSIVGEHSRQWISNYAQKSFPLPSLRVQARIVEILDKFAQLEAELEAELEARKKQYAYYRDQLLNFSQCPPLNVNIEWKTLGEVCDRTKGTKITATQMKAMHKSNAPVKIFAGGQTFALVDYNDLPKKDIYFFPSIIVKSRGIIEFEYYDKPFSHKSELWSYHTSSPDVNAKFLYYYLKTREDHFQQLGSVMQMPQISIPATENFPIPIPPLSEQRRIVDILDRFDTLTNSISEGLPKEIALRRKQYEYYRDALLNFPRAEVTA